jgi:hypothetical protein
LAAVSPLAGLVMDRVGGIRMTRGALVLLALACMGFMVNSWAVRYGALVLYGMAAAVLLISTLHLTIKTLSMSQKGFGMGCFFTSTFVAAALGVALSARVIQWAQTVSHGFDITMWVSVGMMVVGLLFIMRPGKDF